MHSRQQLLCDPVVRRTSVANDENGFHPTNYRLLMRQVFTAFLILIGAARTAAAQDDPYRDQRSPESRAKMDTYFKEIRSIELGRKQIQDSPAESFVEIDFGSLPIRLMTQMYSRLWTLLQPEVHPQPKSQTPPRSTMSEPRIDREAALNHPPDLPDLKPGRMRVRVFAAYATSQTDLVEYRWEHEGLQLRVLVARDVVRMDLDLAEVEEKAQSERESPTAYLRGLLPKLIRLEGEMNTVPPHSYKTEIPLPEVLEEGIQFSSNPDQILTSMDYYTWHKRIDGFVESGKLALLFYMRPGPRSGFQDPSKWFDDDFRAAVHQKAREQGKLPPEVPAPGE